MEELDFFEEICLTSLYATKAVKFEPYPHEKMHNVNADPDILIGVIVN